jgi:endonuclease/exonuclease/phosphatase family metal-dependent hydrolase
MPRRLLFLPVLLAGLLATPVAAPSLRVMSYNIHHGEGLDGKLDLERIAQVILDARADLVGLQEVDRGVARTQQRDLPAELAKLTGMTVHFDQNIAHQGGDYGNAVLTKFPIKHAKNTPLKMFGQGEQRGVQQILLEVHGREVLFLNTHLDQRREPAERESSAEELRRIVAAGKTPVILVGDFNAVPDSTAIAKVREFLTDAWTIAGKGAGPTIPVAKPTRRIDYIWVSAPSIEPVKMEVLSSAASDHLPIVAELRLR